MAKLQHLVELPALAAGSGRVLGSHSISRQIGIPAEWWCGGVCAHVQVRFLQPHTVSKSDTSRDNIGRQQTSSPATSMLSASVSISASERGLGQVSGRVAALIPCELLAREVTAFLSSQGI